MRNFAVHAEYLIWAMWAIKKANDAWRAQIPYRGETLMDREGFHSHLFAWGVETGLIPDPGRERDMPYSYYVALAFRDDQEAVKTQARNYWRIKIRERRAVNA